MVRIDKKTYEEICNNKFIRKTLNNTRVVVLNPQNSQKKKYLIEESLMNALLWSREKAKEIMERKKRKAKYRQKNK